MLLVLGPLFGSQLLGNNTTSSYKNNSHVLFPNQWSPYLRILNCFSSMNEILVFLRNVKVVQELSARTIEIS
jgi:hypothetical protein